MKESCYFLTGGTIPLSYYECPGKKVQNCHLSTSHSDVSGSSSPKYASWDKNKYLKRSLEILGSAIKGNMSNKRLIYATKCMSVLLILSRKMDENMYIYG
jgi:hypothetical protein